MKKVFAIIAFIFFATKVLGIDTLSMVEEGKEWITTTTATVSDEGYKTTYRTWIEGDTVFNGVKCKKLHSHSFTQDGYEKKSVSCCRQEEGKFYEGDRLMFDFSLQAGDTFSSDKYTFTVTSVGAKTLADGISRKCLTVSCQGQTDLWVEGIGSLSMGIYSNDFVSLGVKIEMIACYQKGMDLLTGSTDTYDVMDELSRRFVVEGKTWIMRGQSLSPSSSSGHYTYESTYRFEGDTIIDQQIYKMLHKHRIYQNGDEERGILCFRQDGDKIYTPEGLVFDFGMSVGGALDSGNGSYYKVSEAKDTLLLDAVSRKSVSIEEHSAIDGEVLKQDTWVEGVGSLNSGPFVESLMIAGGGTYELVSCTLHDRVIYKKEANHILLPTIDNHTDADTPIYDLAGRRLNRLPEKGIYIQGGKKRVVK